MHESNQLTDAVRDRAIIAAWHVGAIDTLATPPTGTINRTVLVASARGAFALRAYRHGDRRRVEHEHAIIAHVCAKGIPALPPVPLPTGDTILEQDGRFYALFPAAAGRQLRRAALTQPHIAAMGHFLADLHTALEDFPPAQALHRSFSFDTARTLHGIERLIAHIAARPVHEPVDGAVMTSLVGRRRWLQERAPAAPPNLEALEHQVIHGDYQDTNLFWHAATIGAVIDWDQAYSAPRAWEVVRTLDLVFSFEPTASRVFLDGYRRQLPLSADKLDTAATAYGLMRAHDLWMYEAYYVDGNHRLGQFVSGDLFVPSPSAGTSCVGHCCRPASRRGGEVRLHSQSERTVPRVKRITERR